MALFLFDTGFHLCDLHYINIASGSEANMTTLCEMEFFNFLWLIWVLDMLNSRSKPIYDEIFIKIAIWGANLALCSAPKFGPHPGGSYGGRGGLSFYVGGKGR